jgi:hypothetical protein
MLRGVVAARRGCARRGRACIEAPPPSDPHERATMRLRVRAIRRTLPYANESTPRGNPRSELVGRVAPRSGLSVHPVTRARSSGGRSGNDQSDQSGNAFFQTSSIRRHCASGMSFGRPRRPPLKGPIRSPAPHLLHLRTAFPPDWPLTSNAPLESVVASPLLPHFGHSINLLISIPFTNDCGRAPEVGDVGVLRHSCSNSPLPRHRSPRAGAPLRSLLLRSDGPKQLIDDVAGEFEDKIRVVQHLAPMRQLVPEPR